MPRIGIVVATCALFGCSSELLFDTKQVALPGGGTAYLAGYSNAFVIEGAAGTLLVDTKMEGPADDLAKVVRDAASPLRWIAITHPHKDHVQGLSRYARDEGEVRVFGAAGIAGMTVPKGLRLEPLAARASLSLGDETVELIPFGHAHTGADLAIWFPARRLLLTGDLFQCGYYPHAERDDGGSYVGLASAIATLVALGPETIIGGHGEVCDAAAMADYLAYVRSLADDEADDPGYRDIVLPGSSAIASFHRNVACARLERDETGGFGWRVPPTVAGFASLQSIRTHCD